MKCVCPMGGDRTCPDDCLLAVWANLSTTDRKAQRRAVAEQLFRQNFTQEQIATQLGVSQYTISMDLRNLLVANNSPRARTSTNPRGAGRPRGSGARAGAAPTRRERPRAAPTVEREERAAQLLDQGRTTRQIASDLGIGERAAAQAIEHVRIRREAEAAGRANAEINPSTLSLSAQERLASALRQQERRLAAEFEQRVQAEVRNRLSAVLPQLRERERQAQMVMARRRGIMRRPDYDLILTCVHPDSRLSASSEKLAKAFRLWDGIKPLVLDETQSQSAPLDMPQTVEELLARRQRVREERAAARRRQR